MKQKRIDNVDNVHVVSVVNIHTGIENKIFINLQEAINYYYDKKEKMNEKIYTIYLEEKVALAK